MSDKTPGTEICQACSKRLDQHCYDARCYPCDCGAKDGHWSDCARRRSRFTRDSSSVIFAAIEAAS